jgi:hypothetical protein
LEERGMERRRKTLEKHWNDHSQFLELFWIAYRIKSVTTRDRGDNREKIIGKKRSVSDGLDKKKSRNPIEDNREGFELDMEIGNVY